MPPEWPEWPKRPKWKDEISHRLAGLKLTATREAAIIEEFSQHLDDIYEEHIADGATPMQAEKLTRETARRRPKCRVTSTSEI